MNLNEQMAADAAAADAEGDIEIPENEILVKVRELAAAQLQAEEWIDQLEERLSKAKAYWRDIAEKQLPTKIQEAGLSSFTLADGRRVHVKTEVYCSVTDDNRGILFDWLRKNNLDGVIKNVVAVQFPKGDDEKAIEFAKAVAEMGLIPEQKQDVHPMTLKATLKEQIEKGVDVPLDSLKAFVVDRSVVDAPKAKKVGKK